MAALLLPLRAVSVSLGKGRSTMPLPGWIIKNGIKWTNRDADSVVALHAESPALLRVTQQLQVRPRL